MCGIAGIAGDAGLDAQGSEAALLRMLEALRHRGPDDRGWTRATSREGSGAWLANARLAILDLSPAGHQPMRDERTGNWIVLNGEIYNHLEVRADLDDGRPWRSQSDTETFLRAYGAWGPACLSRLRGMFAVAVWDEGEGSLWCARDRLGIKPLYWHGDGRRVVFASEVRALLESGLVERNASVEGLAGYLRFGSVQEPHTLVEGVLSLPPAHWMRVRRGQVVERHEYWSPHVASAPRSDGGAPEAPLREHLERSVREHLLSDVPVAAFLSGGLDSSAVVALAARATPSLRTFTVAMGDASLDESEAARAVASHVGTRHEEVRLSSEEVSRWVPAAVASLDQPSGDGVNTYVVSRAVAAAGVRVVLSGLGGDELFGGYPSFAWLPRLARWAPWAGLVPARLRAALAGGGDRGRRIAEMTRAGATLEERYRSLRSLWPEGPRPGLPVPDDGGAGAAGAARGLPLRSQVGLLELRGYLRNTLLRDSDATSMAHSLELRVPFLDHLLLEACLRSGAAEEEPPKAVLRRAVADLLPPAVLERPKRGFVLPMDAWMRDPLRGFVREGLDALVASRVLDEARVASLRDRFGARTLAWSRLWPLVTLGHWLRAHRVAPASA